MDESLQRQLMEAGFSKYESAAISALLGSEPLTASEICRIAEIPSSKIGEVMGRLVARGIVSVIPVGKRKKYAIENPKTTLIPLLAEKKRRIEEIIEKVENLAVQPRKETIILASGRDSVLKLAESAVRSAKKEVWASSRDFSTPKWFVDAVKDGVKRGVSFYLVGRVTPETLRRARKYQRLGVHVKRTEDELPVMIIVDDEYVFFKTGRWSEAAAIHSQPLARFLKRYLQHIWQYATPL